MFGKTFLVIKDNIKLGIIFISDIVKLLGELIFSVS